MHPLAALTARLFRLRPVTARRRPTVTVPSRRSRLALQALEDRTAPAVFNIANGDITGLMSAITTSNSNNQSDTINLAAGGTYTFSGVADATEGGNALPSILTDSGLATNTLTINGNDATLVRSTAVGTPFFRFLRVAMPSTGIVAPTVTVNHVNFTGGQIDPAATGSNKFGGAVYVDNGNLTLSDCTFTGNQAPNGGAVGASQSAIPPRPLNLTRCTFTQNTATGDSGGAVYILGSTALTVLGSTFTGNVSADEGGAIRVQTSSALTTVTGSIFANNTANGGNGGGAIFIQGTTTIDATTVRDNVSAVGGGGVWNQGTLTVTNSTISGNRANSSVASGGGIFVQGNFTLQNSTIFGNRAGSGGGVAYVLGGDVGSIVSSTITGNNIFFGLASGGGIEIGGSNLSLGSSVVAGNVFEATVSNGTGPDVDGTVNSLGYNFIGNGSGATFGGNTAGNQVGTTLAPLNPQLGPLQNNGGPTQTRLPLAGSPLINAGDPAFVPPPNSDQRGLARVQFGRVDIGAAEFGNTSVMTAAVNGGSAQRSMVTSLTVTFSTLVTFAGNPATAFQLTRTGPSEPNGDVTVSVDLSASTLVQTIARLSFSGGFTTSGSLMDGLYTLTILSSQVSASGQALDGDGNGLPGGDSVTSLHRLFGDVNGDRFVNGTDFADFRTAFGTSLGGPNYNAAFDVNGDGFVNGADFADFRLRFGLSI